MASDPSKQPAKRPVPRLYLVTPPVQPGLDLGPALAAALAAADVSALLLRLAYPDERSRINAAKALAPMVQDRGVALLLDGDAALVARAGADGAHLTGLPALEAALPVLKPDRIAGVGGLATRHEAMVAGELGADYVMFGAPQPDGTRPGLALILERIGWWAELFEPPCVGFAQDLAEVGPLAAAGSDFVALGDWLWRDPAQIPALVAEAARRLQIPEAVG